MNLLEWAAQQLFSPNTALAYSRAARWKATAQRRHADMAEVESAALVGLWRAACAFQSSRELKFSTLATTCIDREISAWFKQAYRVGRPGIRTTMSVPESFGERDRSLAAVDDRDEVEAYLRCCTKRTRTIVRQYCLRGLRVERIARRLRTTAKEVREVLKSEGLGKAR